ncbi:hypothetical protein [Bacillus sp. JJ722]|uniref:hypothetical protein n=1 Tax=Bacillus sp. JJ722 TaxID=3122973 RepID=UPI002FFF7327
MEHEVKTDHIMMRLKREGDEVIKELIVDCANLGLGRHDLVRRALFEFWISLEGKPVDYDLFPPVLDVERIKNEAIHMRFRPDSPSDRIIKEYLDGKASNEVEKNQIVSKALLNYINSQLDVGFAQPSPIKVLENEQLIKDQQAEIVFLKEQLKNQDEFIKGVLALNDKISKVNRKNLLE